MKTKCSFQKFFSVSLCCVLIAAMALTAAACRSQADPNANSSAGVESSGLGEGKTTFTFAVVDGEGQETDFTVKTDEATVGAALLAVNLIAGEEGPYGLYVKTVNGVTADYDTDGTYWAFYINGEYAATGVDATSVTEGAVYSFKIEK